MAVENAAASTVARVGPMSDRASSAVTVYPGMAELPADVTAFLAGYASDELCLSQSWFELLTCYSPEAGHQPRIYVVRSRDGANIDGVMFMMSASQGRPRKLLSLTNFYTMSYAPLLRRNLGDGRATLDALAGYIARERPRWDLIELRGFIDEYPATAELTRAFRRAGMLASTYAQFDNWFYPTNGITAGEYFKSRPSQVRNTITRKLKKVQKEHKIDFHLYASGDDLAIGLKDYEKIYAQSWKEPEAYPEFIPQLLRRAAVDGCLRLGVLRVDGEPAAAQIWLLTGGRATIYKLAYDEKFAPLSVGSLLTKMMFDYVLDNEKVSEVDYGVGSEPYKLDWMSDCRHIVGLICFNRFSARGLLAAGLHAAGRIARSRLGRGGASGRKGRRGTSTTATERAVR
jgi:CelD/BcsL family acetyltransferase involved in cellulose biosynthesis